MRLMPVAAKQKEAETEAQKIRENLEEATKEFEKVATERTELFLKAYEHVENEIDAVYKSLTKTQKFPGARRGLPGTRAHPPCAGGSAFIQMESADEPFLHGIRFTAMPPNKGVRKIEEVCASLPPVSDPSELTFAAQLSGGEKTVAALALLFTIHSFRPAPFFVLDEVDAALDPENVALVSTYVR